ncbi:MAG: DNA topoisomerase 3 [Lachnospiraceae bacterium]|nr:DNA topoisomerase 3 [Lachnospiraceae bacterium]
MENGNNSDVYRLVICEKPSVAQAVAKILGAGQRREGYLEGAGFLVSWCIGHLAGLAAADAYDARYSRWALEDLPILPKEWKLTVAPATRKQLEILKGLMARPDVEELIEATDAGREGELIFRLVYRMAGCCKPFKRLWISSMEDSAIRAGFEKLRDGAEYDSLYEAALCRAKADWLVGINGTRLFTTFYGGRTLNIGRVVTPTLALLAEREAEIAGFQKEKYHVVELDCGGFRAAGRRFKSKTDAEKLRKSCLGKPAQVQSVERQEKAEKPPKLYDLTTLQREANRAYGYTAQQTLDYLQSLYEKKLATYPRTASRYLTGDMEEGLAGLCQSVAGAFPFGGSFFGEVAAGQVTDSSKVSDHHAILPTREVTSEIMASLPTGEKKILAMVAARLLCAVSPQKYIYEDTEVKLCCMGEEFSAKGHREVSGGWKETERAFQKSMKAETGSESVQEKEASPLPELSEGQALTVEGAAVKSGTTSSKKSYTEDTLLSAMESAGAEDFREAGETERKGIGTPATRAGIIEKLVKGGFAERRGRQLIPTAQGMELIKVLPDTIKSAKLTAEWEAALKEVERGKRSPEEFLEGIARMVRGMVAECRNAGVQEGAALSAPALSAPAKEVIGKCPRCGKPVYEGKKSFYCSGYREEPPCGFALWKENPYFKSKRKELTKAVAVALLKEGRVEMKGLYSEKKGKTYDGIIVMEDTGEKYVNFRLEFGEKK